MPCPMPPLLHGGRRARRQHPGGDIKEPGDTLRIGFIGTGSIASAMVEGFCTSALPCRILVSPRNERRALDLAGRFAQVRRAGSNQEVLDGCDLAVLAVRPAAAAEVLEKLSFREDHTVLSLIPTLRLQELSALAPRAFRALPLPTVARHLGLVPYLPADDRMAAILAHLGGPLAMRDERELHLLWAATGLISPFFALMAAVQGWCVAEGADPETSRRYTASMYAALAALAEQHPGVSFQELAREAATPGGLNEMAAAMAEAGSTYLDVARSLDAIRARLGEPPLS